MPRYRFTGDWPAVFVDLQHGVNATVVGNPDAEQEPDGSTVVLAPGDEVVTADPFESALLEEIPEPAPAPPAPPAAPAAPAPAPAAVPATPAAPAEEIPA